MQHFFYVIRIFAFFLASISAEKLDLADPILVVTTTILGAIKTTTVIAKNYVPNNLNQSTLIQIIRHLLLGTKYIIWQ